MFLLSRHKVLPIPSLRRGPSERHLQKMGCLQEAPVQDRGSAGSISSPPCCPHPAPHACAKRLRRLGKQDEAALRNWEACCSKNAPARRTDSLRRARGAEEGLQVGRRLEPKSPKPLFPEASHSACPDARAAALPLRSHAPQGTDWLDEH